jgi:hypothetical protein
VASQVFGFLEYCWLKLPLTMLAKYKIKYAVTINGHPHPSEHLTNDPVEAEQFLSEILERGFRIECIMHEGEPLPQRESDRMIGTAAGILGTRLVTRSLGIDNAEAHHRFGFPA